MNATDLFSRAILAGYEPDRLHRAKALVVGLGALGQNVVQDLALSGIGNLLLVDFDDFEDHNATRSPFFPGEGERRTFGLGKAPVVAARAAACATAPSARIWYLREMIQLVGDAAIRWADVVVSAVDSVAARAWLAQRCRVNGKVMVEGGFSGPRFNLSVFGGGENEPCYRCHGGTLESSGSCTQYALAAEAASIIPAIQTTAAVLGGLMTEQTIQVLHGAYRRFGERLYGDLRAMSAQASKLSLNPGCPALHGVLEVMAELPVMPADLGELLLAVREAVGPAQVMLAEPALATQSCTKCLRMCDIRSTEAAWLRAPRCTACGGPWAITQSPSPQSVSVLLAEERIAETVRGFSLDALGLRPSGCVTVQTLDARLGLALLPGQAEDAWMSVNTRRP